MSGFTQIPAACMGRHRLESPVRGGWDGATVLGGIMRLNAPTFLVWLISLILAALGVLLYLGIVPLPFITKYVSAFWFVCAGYVLLCLGNLLKGF